MSPEIDSQSERPAFDIIWRKSFSFTKVDESSSIFDSPRPLKKSKFETRKRGLVRISDEEGPPSAKHSMKKIPEHRQVRIRHTLARRGAETEKMIHETVSRACAILAAQGSDAPLPRSTKRRSGTEFRDSDSRTGIAVSSHPSKPLVVKKSRPATIFDVTNFEWVLEMSLRRPRAFVGLYKTMKYQHRILEKRRWVEKNRKLYDKVQFTKFLYESSHSEVDMLEKTRLLKAEKDMERVLGVVSTGLEFRCFIECCALHIYASPYSFGHFSAIKDLAYWYGMNSRYAVEAEVLASQALEKARRFDMAVELLKNEEAKKEGEGVVLNLHIPFQPRFKRPRRADNDIDLLPPGDFSPYSTDEEWEDYYEKKDRFENHPLQPQLSWSSFRVDDCDGDDDDRASELARLRSCSCGVANERTMQWVAKLPTTSTRKCYSEELLPVDNLCISPSLHQIPVRWNSALSCISLERLPILQPATSTVKAKAVVNCRRQFSFQHDAKLLPSLRQRSISLSPSWKPEVFSLSQKDGRESLCESRRDRLMYRRALSFCRFRVYNTTKLLTPRQRQRSKTGERLILSRIRREKDLPQQWIRRSSPHRQDYIRMVRYRLEVQGQRSIPVLWRSRPDRCESPTSWADRDGDNETQIIQDTPILEPRECQLECPIAVYNPPPTWNSMMRSQSEKRTDVGRSLRNSSSEPSAFQRVLARPQPIDISRLDVELETDEDSNDVSVAFLCFYFTSIPFYRSKEIY
uniref:Protein kinase domain-containing protein n=1 Tax=Angiostrongylus cantonensis TaxID=6313 RepID=A0A0K0DRM0_ANGCA